MLINQEKYGIHLVIVKQFWLVYFSQYPCIINDILSDIMISLYGKYGKPNEFVQANTNKPSFSK